MFPLEGSGSEIPGKNSEIKLEKQRKSVKSAAISCSSSPFPRDDPRDLHQLHLAAPDSIICL
jgi:hypothetical protein